MKEINLEELEEWYLKQLKNRFKKEHKILQKLFKMSERELAETKNGFKSWCDPKRPTLAGVEPLDEKSQKIMERFVEKIEDFLGKIDIPTVHNDVSHETSQKFTEEIKKLYIAYNANGKKAIPRFMKQYKLELKEVDLHLRKIGDLANKIGGFLRKNYKDGKDAEAVIKKMPKLSHDIDRLGKIKSKINEMDARMAEMLENLTIMEESLYKFQDDNDVKEYEKIEQESKKKTSQLRDKLKFQKAFKKLKKSLEKGTIYSKGLKEDDIKPYIKRPITKILQDGPKLNILKDILIKTRLMLEDENDPLQLKADLKRRIIDNINQIVGKNILEPLIIDIIEIKKRKDEIESILKTKGIDSQRKELKEKIATATIDMEHFENDLKRRKREYTDLLQKVGEDRNALQKSIEKETGEPVKIKVMISS
jgi:hypothetical protein